MTVRDLQTLLGLGGSSPAKAHEKMLSKEGGKDIKEPKEVKDSKDSKDHKEPKDTKDNKDTKDPKDHKDPKDTKDNKDNKDSKDTKDNKDTKDHKEPKDHKETKDHKDIKDHISEKGELIDKTHKDSSEKLPEFVKGSPDAPISGGSPDAASPAPVGLEALIERLTGLEKEVKELKGKGTSGGSAR